MKEQRGVESTYEDMFALAFVYESLFATLPCSQGFLAGPMEWSRGKILGGPSRLCFTATMSRWIYAESLPVIFDVSGCHVLPGCEKLLRK